ncbi:hypothetical protein RQP46_001639 [Phenoliferia psychrophenolica]
MITYFAVFSTIFSLTSAVAVPLVTPTIPYNEYPPRTTPSISDSNGPKPVYLPLQGFNHLFGFIPIAVNLPRRNHLEEVLVRGLPQDLEGALEKRALAPQQTQAAQTAIAATCVPTGSNDTYISSLFYYGGAGTTTLTTVGSPTDSTRATLVVTAANQSCAIFGQISGANKVTLSFLQIDGARETLGLISGGLALIEMGGDNTGQTVNQVHAYEPREGTGLDCSGMVITNNQIGPSGHAPSGAQQFRRDNTGTYSPGQCGIVIFGAPGSVIYENTIISINRQLLGGINMVDWGPFSGSFIGTQVVNNAVIAYSNYSIGIAGHANVTVSGNTAVQANFGSIESASCFTAYFPLPTPQSFIADNWTTPGCVLQSGFTRSTIVLPICRGPSGVTKVGGIS